MNTPHLTIGTPSSGSPPLPPLFPPKFCQTGLFIFQIQIEKLPSVSEWSVLVFLTEDAVSDGRKL